MADISYQPSSSEKKTVVLIYLLIGIIMILHKDRIENWVWGHLHQALGWRVTFVIVAFISIILVFIPLLSLLPLFILVLVMGLWGWFTYQAWSGLPAQTEGGLGLFASMGKWMTDVIDLNPEIIQEEIINDATTDTKDATS